ncbi:hypothetical protein [Methanococcus voltae]|uniref:Uncharacterized protein n=1 Tax=Methanococcus voltae PS TaxID=523842 RepID=A0ABT2EXR0_METVO|nr:hypothetical protein [Methanococcus voltae]MBP2172764.1 hypothetical protein [Methanococcus voltae]MCS3922650.1 hypothetical protein [Methanococcus voltae PS]
MDYSEIELSLRNREILVDKGAYGLKRKFAFLLQKEDILLFDETKYYANDEVMVLDDYSYSDSKRPKEYLKVFEISNISKK